MAKTEIPVKSLQLRRSTFKDRVMHSFVVLQSLVKSYEIINNTGLRLITLQLQSDPFSKVLVKTWGLKIPVHH